MHRLDEGFKLAKLAAAKRRRSARIRSILTLLGALAVAGLAVFFSLNTNLLTGLFQGGSPPTPDAPIEEPAPDVYEAVIVDLAGDPLVISAGDMSGAVSALREVPTAEAALATRSSGEVSLLEDTMVAASQRFMATLPSSPQDFAFYQAQQARRSPVAQPVAAVTTMPDATAASSEATTTGSDEALVDDAEGGWGETVSGEEKALPDFAPDVVENTTTVLPVLSSDVRRPARQDVVLQILIERDMASLASETPFSARDLNAFGAALKPLLNRDGLKPGDVVALRGRTKAGSTHMDLMQASISGVDGYVGALARADDGSVGLAADPWVGVDLLARQSGENEVVAGRQYRLLDAIYSTAVRNGVPTPVLGEAIKLMSRAFDLSAFASPKDRLILAYGPGSVTMDSGRLLYVAVEGPERRLECYVYKGGSDADYSCFTETSRGQAVAVPSGMFTPVNGVLTSTFGPRMHPIFHEVRVHTGVDWAAPAGTAVMAAYDGVVISAGNAGGYGNLLRLSHAGGRETRYAHLKAFADGIAPGVQVTAGQLVGFVGTTGNSTGPHLHFELRLAGAPVDPLGQQTNQLEAVVADGSAVDELTEQIVAVESGGNANARNPLSTAVGAGQFLQSTWTRMMQTYRPDLASSMSRSDLLALRGDPTISREMVRNLAREGEAYLKARGHAVTPGRLYLCHFLGMQGAALILASDASLPLVQVLEASVIQANPFLTSMTVADVQAWADRKMSGKRPAPSATPATPMVATSSPEFAAYRSAIATLLAPIADSGTDAGTQDPQAPQADEDNA
ncbi:murein DD-endopeptidase MepM/ murein hydrolase activator NlpD [Devosia sp. UYZn731]|uniref:peptidoglycan DD-metalloendopeptidase family protein n=1 Tax=Devosia sp. UYZn731 TaxID=3156345 RepID=UPI00339B8641